MLNPRLIRPDTLPGALEALKQFGNDAKVVAGGTATTLLLHQGLIAPRVLIDLQRLPDLDYIQSEPGVLRLGPLVCLRDVERSPVVRRHSPGLAEVCRVVGNVRVRNQATLGGNLAEADYASDPPAMLLALGASVTAAEAGGVRSLPVGDLFAGFYATTLRPTELITEVTVPGLSGDVRMAYLKFKTRASHDRPCLGVAVVAAFDGGRCRDLRVAVGAACETPRRLPQVEGLAQGNTLSGKLIAEIAEAYAGGIETLDDLRGSAWYRTQMIRVHVRRALEEVARDGR